jgi:AraC-like DNA-binding protein
MCHPGQPGKALSTMPNHPPAARALVRAASLTHFDALAAAAGLDARALVAEQGLPARCLDEPDLMIPAQAVGRLLECTAERSGDAAFGLRLAQSRRLSNLGPLALLVRDEPSLRRALEVLVAHLPLHNEALSLRVEEAGGLVTIRARLDTAGGPPMRQATELVVAVAYRLLCIFLGAGWRPRLVCFAHRAPPSVAAHRALFGPAVEFGHEFDGIVCNSAELDAPNPGADPVLARYTQRLLARPADAAPRLSDRVREFIVLLLPRGHGRVEVVAQHLGVDRRTVARRLAAEGTQFGALLDEVRQELLERCLLDGGRPLGEIAALLGFSSPSVFARWHRQRFGVTARTRRSPGPAR